MNSEEVEYQVAAAAALAADAHANAAPQLEVLGHRLLAEFAQAEKDRKDTEERWLRDLRQYRGQYDPEVLANIGPNRSKAFVRKTRVKVKTIDSRVADLLFPAGSEKNWEISPTPKPSIDPDLVAQIEQSVSQMLTQQAQAQADAMAAQSGQPPQQVPPVAAPKELVEQQVLAVAKEAARNMSKTVEDQLVEARYKEVSIRAIHSAHLYGTGIVKGPLVERKIRTRFVKKGGKWAPQSETYVVPFVDYVPIWRFYPDMSATQIDQCRFIFERHLMTRAELVALAARKSFNKDKIVSYVESNPDGQVALRYIDNELRVIGERTTIQGLKAGQYEVLERWGYLDGASLKEAGVKVPTERLHETFFANVWLLPNGEVIRSVLQPIDGSTWPYHLYYFDKDETSIFAEGLSAVMRDDQTMMNAAVRLMLDNAAITAGPQIEVNPALLSSATKLDEIYPWKIWLRNSTNPGARAVNAIELPSRINELTALAQMFEANADEVTAIPRYMSGENATQGAAGTAAGMSMLMGAANIVIKDLITSWDEGVTRPLLQSLYHWNMKFNRDDSIKGDFDVKARGTASLVAKEVRARQLNEFSAMASDPLDAPFVKRHALLKQRAEANELGDVIKTEEEVQQEQQTDEAQKAKKMQQDLLAAQVAEAQGKAAKLMAEAELTKKKLDEMMANIGLIIAKEVSEKVSALYAATQAAGVVTSTPFIAPAADEILKSSGWKDATPDPSIADLNRRPVQATDGVAQVLQKGARFEEQPRDDMPPEISPLIVEPQGPQGAEVPPQTGMVGKEAGIETQEIDG